MALRREGCLQTDEVISPGRRFIRQAQEEVFKEGILAVKAERELPSASKLQPLRPVLDEDGILQCDEDFAMHYPIILSRSHSVKYEVI